MDELNDFRDYLMRNGIIGYSRSDLEYLLNTARLCAKTTGVPLGAAMAAATAGVGSVTVPVVGAIPGWVAGALAGFFSGTVACTIGRGALKGELDKLLRD